MSKAAYEAVESVGNFIDVEADALELHEYVEFLEVLLDVVQSRLIAAQEDLYGNN
jgi:hypothetical protein